MTAPPRPRYSFVMNNRPRPPTNSMAYYRDDGRATYDVVDHQAPVSDSVLAHRVYFAAAMRITKALNALEQ